MFTLDTNCGGKKLAPSKECLGCENCSGVCREIVDFMIVPVIVLKPKSDS